MIWIGKSIEVYKLKFLGNRTTSDYRIVFRLEGNPMDGGGVKPTTELICAQLLVMKIAMGYVVGPKHGTTSCLAEMKHINCKENEISRES